MDANKKFFIISLLKGVKGGGVRSLVIFIAIAIASAVIAAFANIYADIDKKVSSELNNYGPNMVIYSLQNHINSEILDKKLQSKPIKALGKYLFSSVSLGSARGVMMGVNFSNLSEIMPYLQLKDGDFISVDFDDKNALICVDLAKILGVKVGDIVEISKESGEIYKVKIKGIVFDGDKEDNLIIVSLNVANEILNVENQINYAQAIIDANFEEISEISRALSDDTMRFEPVSKISKANKAILEKIRLLMILTGICILFIVCICVNTSLSSILLSRIKEFALSRALGASKIDVLKQIVFEIAILSLCSAIVGAILGYFLAICLGQLIFNSSVDFRFVGFILSLFLSAIFAAFAAYYPVKKALKENLAGLLRE